ncbi:glycosyltransferase 87 family protein [Pseudolysinimonas sp.]|uniref:glycosyltransferase 87 family protein n=1 Tax=Pseudolysinimonas sp. TaxID=2680009 RepID=UPI003F7F644E
MTAASRALRHPLPLWIAFVLVHLIVGVAAFSYPDGSGIGDVRTTYPIWVQHGFETGRWVGLQLPWVYPILALPPMIAADALGPAFVAPIWLGIVFVVDAVAFAFVVHGDPERRRAPAAWWWLVFLLLLGPIALTRIDSLATAPALIGVLLLARAPRTAGALLAVGAWVKVWPAALVAAAVVAVRRRFEVLLGAVVLTVVVVAVTLLLGGAAHLLSFVTEQSGRGLQIESGLATPWMWSAALHPGGPISVYYDLGILTYQVRGPGVAGTAALATPLLVLAVGAVLVLGIVAARRGSDAAEILPAMALGFTTALIVANKVGSPQYVGWIAVPIVLGLAVRATGRGQSFAGPAGLTLVIAILTQVIYPMFYGRLLNVDPTLVLVLTVRNLLLLGLFVWALTLLVRRVARPVGEDGEWLPAILGGRPPRLALRE